LRMNIITAIDQQDRGKPDAIKHGDTYDCCTLVVTLVFHRSDRRPENGRGRMV
jgi:hypothetical protein